MQWIGQPTQLPNTLPTSQEACTLVAPNVHVFSEEIKAKVEDEKNQLLKMVKMQMIANKKQQEQA